MIKPDSLLPERELVSRLTEKDQLTFPKLYDRYAPVLLGVITKILTNKVEAEKVLEATFAAIILELDEFQPEKQPLFIWLLQIARRTAIDALKERKQGIGAELQLTKSGKVISPNWQKNAPSPPTVVLTNSANTWKKELLDSVLFKNCTPEEAALTVGIPIEQARQQLRLAMQQLRKTNLA